MLNRLKGSASSGKYATVTTSDAADANLADAFTIGDDEDDKLTMCVQKKNQNATRRKISFDAPCVLSQ